MNITGYGVGGWGGLPYKIARQVLLNWMWPVYIQPWFYFITFFSELFSPDRGLPHKSAKGSHQKFFLKESPKEGMLYCGGVAVLAILECLFADTFITFIWRFTVHKLLIGGFSLEENSQKTRVVCGLGRTNYGSLQNVQPPIVDPHKGICLDLWV